MQALRPLLRQLFAADPDISQHQQAVAETQFTKQFQPPPQAQPLSETPLLITRVDAIPYVAGQTRLVFVTERGRIIQLGVRRRPAHFLCKLIAGCIRLRSITLHLFAAPPAPI